MTHDPWGLSTTDPTEHVHRPLEPWSDDPEVARVQMMELMNSPLNDDRIGWALAEPMEPVDRLARLLPVAALHLENCWECREDFAKIIGLVMDLEEATEVALD
jgi:hypothetical protein